MKARYIPFKDEIILEIQPVKRKVNKKIGLLKLWWNAEGDICAIAIEKFTEELEEFRKNLNVIRLGGIWKEIKITEEDIEKTREELLRKIEERW